MQNRKPTWRTCRFSLLTAGLLLSLHPTTGNADCTSSLGRQVAAGNIDFVQQCLSATEEVSAWKLDDALTIAASEGHFKIARILVGKGADVNNEILSSEQPLLIEAASKGHLEIVKILVDGGADINARNARKETALIVATSNGHVQVAQALIRSGANLNAADVNSKTALMIAASRKEPQLAKTLIENGADVNTVGFDTALMIAVSEGRADMARLLIDQGADIDAKGNHGRTALMIAASQGRADMARLLIDQGADIDAKSPFGQTALMHAAFLGSPPIVKMLIDGGADVNAKTRDGGTALLSAAHKGRNEAAKLLIDGGADVNAEDKYGHTALALAEKNSNTALARMLKDAGAGPIVPVSWAFMLAIAGIVVACILFTSAKKKARQVREKKDALGDVRAYDLANSASTEILENGSDRGLEATRGDVVDTHKTIGGATMRGNEVINISEIGMAYVRLSQEKGTQDVARLFRAQCDKCGYVYQETALQQIAVQQLMQRRQGEGRGAMAIINPSSEGDAMRQGKCVQCDGTTVRITYE